VRFHLILRKTFADLARPLLLLGYFLVFGGVLFFLALGFANNDLENVADSPLVQQEAEFYRAFLGISVLWAGAIPLMLLGAVASATSLAKEAEQGTLQILLSKPVRRTEVLLGTFGAIVGFVLFVGIASLLLTGLALFEFSGTSAAALEEGLFGALPGLLAFVLLLAVFVAALGLALAVRTGNRLQTGLGSLVVPALYFAFFPIRALAGASYEDYYLYLLDVNYHFGNAFVVLVEALNGGFDAETQAYVTTFTGVYDAEQAEAEPQNLPESLDLAGHVDPVVSLLAIVLVSAGLLAYATVRFQRMDV
jgi:ABC-2 type transport system permease protein